VQPLTNSFRLGGRVALITGAAGAFGRAIALGCASVGARLLGGDGQLHDLTSIHAGEIGLPGPYAASSLPGRANNIPAEPWPAAAHPDRLDAITSRLRRHALLPAAV
jgi:NAD(P)-dependent dehydrogenase (short-subunit alcohol dehydrogenase family)